MDYKEFLTNLNENLKTKAVEELQNEELVLGTCSTINNTYPNLRNIDAKIKLPSFFCFIMVFKFLILKKIT